ncbi:MAG: hypothetical protein JWM80_469, partial [Cyanobacteria bacterium RYN_339]|nr:hypothetical protein [Cyanobacteria bacterium RYN_339]
GAALGATLGAAALGPADGVGLAEPAAATPAVGAMVQPTNARPTRHQGAREAIVVAIGTFLSKN